MRTIVKGKNYEVPERVRDYAERKLGRLERLLDDRSDATVELSVEQHRSVQDSHIVDVTLVIDGQTLRSSAAAPTHQAGIDAVLDKIERRAVDFRETSRVRKSSETVRGARPSRSAGRRAARGRRGRRAARADRQGQALRHRADVRGGRGRADGGARPRVLRVRERGERARGDPVPAARGRLRADRAGRRRRVHEGRADPAAPARTDASVTPGRRERTRRASGSTWPSASGLRRAAERAGEIGAQAVQVFVDNPTAWTRRRAAARTPGAFRDRLAELDVWPVAVHASYLVNLAGARPDVPGELDRGPRLGPPGRAATTARGS